MASMIIMSCSAFGLGAIGVYDYESRPPLAATVIFFLVLLSCGFALGYGPLTNVVMTEVTSLRLRDMTQRTAGCARVVANFIVGFTLPYMLATIDLQLAFLFGGICLFGLIFTYFCVPECKGRSLEEIEYMFHQGVPSRKFRSYNLDLHHGSEVNSGGDDSVHNQETLVEGKEV